MSLKELLNRPVTRREVVAGSVGIPLAAVFLGLAQAYKSSPLTQLRELNEFGRDRKLTVDQARNILPFAYNVFQQSEFYVPHGRELLDRTHIIPPMEFIEDITTEWGPTREQFVRSVLSQQMHPHSPAIIDESIHMLKNRTTGSAIPVTIGTEENNQIFLINLDDINRNSLSIQSVPSGPGSDCSPSTSTSQVHNTAIHEWAHARDVNSEVRPCVKLQKHIAKFFPDWDNSFFRQSGFNILLSPDHAFVVPEEMYASYVAWKCNADARTPMVYTYQRLFSPIDFANLQLLIKHADLTNTQLARWHYESNFEDFIFTAAHNISIKTAAITEEEVLNRVLPIWFNNELKPNWSKIAPIVPGIVEKREFFTPDNVRNDPSLCRRVNQAM